MSARRLSASTFWVAGTENLAAFACGLDLVCRDMHPEGRAAFDLVQSENVRDGVARPVLKVAAVSLVEPPSGHGAIYRHRSPEGFSARLNLHADKATDVHAVLVSDHYPVVCPEVVLRWCNPPAEATQTAP